MSRGAPAILKVWYAQPSGSIAASRSNGIGASRPLPYVPARSLDRVNSGDRPAFLFSFSDAPVMKALSLFREEKRA